MPILTLAPTGLAQVEEDLNIERDSMVDLPREFGANFWLMIA